MAPHELPGKSPSISVFLRSALLVILAGCPAVLASLTDVEIRDMASALSQRQYSLFGNAILTSDLRYELVSANSSFFTLFASPDSALFALDMIATAGNYVQALRHHVALRHLSAIRLASIGIELELKTLANGSGISVSQPTPGLLLVNSVRISAPDIFVGPHIAVHGLEGILTPMPDSANANPDASSPRRLSSIPLEHTVPPFSYHRPVIGLQTQADGHKSAFAVPDFQGKMHDDNWNSQSGSSLAACKASFSSEAVGKPNSDAHSPVRFCAESQTAAEKSLVEEADEPPPYTFEEDADIWEPVGIDAN